MTSTTLRHCQVLLFSSGCNFFLIFTQPHGMKIQTNNISMKKDVGPTLSVRLSGRKPPLSMISIKVLKRHPSFMLMWWNEMTKGKASMKAIHGILHFTYLKCHARKAFGIPSVNFTSCHSMSTFTFSSAPAEIKTIWWGAFQWWQCEQQMAGKMKAFEETASYFYLLWLELFSKEL